MAVAMGLPIVSSLGLVGVGTHLDRIPSHRIGLVNLGYFSHGRIRLGILEPCFKRA